MKIRTLLTGILFGLLTLAPASAQGNTPVDAELKAIAEVVLNKAQDGQNTAADLAAELAEIDALVAKYHNDNREAAAKALIWKAIIFTQVIEDSVTARALFTQVKTDYPGTEAAGQSDRIAANIERNAKAKATVNALIGASAPELDFIWSSNDGFKNLSDLRGKVIVLDFWATWCGPCVASFPQVRELAAHYAGAPVEIIGVTSIQGNVMGLEARPINTKGDPDREMALMHDYIKAKNITWTIAFSEQPVFNEDYGIQGIPYVAIIAPDGTVRHTGLHPASPLADKTEKIDALLREFNLPVPTKG